MIILPILSTSLYALLFNWLGEVSFVMLLLEPDSVIAVERESLLVDFSLCL